jgi:hypothetical protein
MKIKILALIAVLVLAVALFAVGTAFVQTRYGIRL